jgi:hypothetical protein
LAIENEAHFIADRTTSVPFRTGALSPLLLRVHTALFEELPPRASVDKKRGRYTIAHKSEVKG